jgi:DNA-binding NarL/FixJ family response regulator
VQQTRVLIADPADPVRQGLRRLISAQPDLEVIASCRTVDEAVGEAVAGSPDVVLLGHNFAEAQRLEAIRRLVEERPGTPILILSHRPGLDEFLSDVQAGARGYLTSALSPSRLVEAIRTLAGGGCELAPEILKELFAYLSRTGAAVEQESASVARVSPMEKLSPREREVLRLLAQGKGNKEIASLLWISAGTAKTHVRHIFKKLKVSDRTGAVLAALDIDPSKLLPAA